MKIFKFSYLLISLLLIKISHQKEVNTFSNYEIIQQTKIEVNFNVNFTEKIVTGKVKIYLKALDAGEVIILDTKALKIFSVFDSDTGDELDFLVDEYYKLESSGVALKMYKQYNKGDILSIVITFSTTKDGTALDWLKPEQTSGKKYPFMYS